MADFNYLLDEVYQAWSKTTGAANGSWEVSSTGIDCHLPALNDYLTVFSFDEYWEPSDDDTKFVVMAHAAIPWLINKCRELEDEAARLDIEKDELTALAVRTWKED